jgi:RNA polymerase sigma-70 factor (family 1)
MPAVIKSLQTKIAEQGDVVAFKELYYLLYNDLFRFATFFIHQKEIAEEVLQDVFVKLWLQRQALGNINNLKVYLYTAVKNTAINYNKRYPLQSFLAGNLPQLEFEYTNPTPEDIIISSQMVSKINAVIQGMPPRCKLIFILIKEDGLKYREAARVLNVSVKTIENQMGIALKKITAAVSFDIVNKK